MDQLLSVSWWFSSFSAVLPWWLACAVVGLLAWPLTIRLFRGLADSGAALSIGVGLVLVTWTAWMMGFPYSMEHKGLVIRAVLLVVASGWLVVRGITVRDSMLSPTGLAPVILLAVCALLYLTHGIASILLAVLLLAGCSFSFFLEDRGRIVGELRRSVAPFVIGQLLFLLAFLFFANVRSYIPWITFVLADWPAEKLGNMTHLSNILMSTSFPPRDAWFLGEPDNYYYGGHLLVATLAKLTATPATVAFNLGLATIFALTFSLSYSFVYNLVFAVSRKTAAGRGIVWHHGMLWGLLGACAVTLFGNMDAWQQLATRAPEQARYNVERRIEMDRAIAEWQSAPKEAEAEVEATQQPIPTDQQLRWAPENFLQVDFWRSSRAIKGTPPGTKEAGTITEFPMFSAMLGDLHPHHMALPYALLALSACLVLLRRTARPAEMGERRWWRRATAPLLMMGFMIGSVFPVNIWDAVVFTVVYALVIMAARRSVTPGDGWKWVGLGGWLVLLTMIVALVANTRPGAVPMFGKPSYYALAVLLMVAVPMLGSVFLPRIRIAVLFIGTLLLAMLLCGLGAQQVASATTGSAGSFSEFAVRDAYVFGLLALLAGWWTLWHPKERHQWWYAAGATYGITGALALLVSFPFRANFRSPLSTPQKLLDSVLPPVLSPSFLTGDGLIARFWQASPVNPFPQALRTEMRDYLVHWGLFVLPVVLLFLARLMRFRMGVGRDRFFGFAMLMVLIVAFCFNYMQYWLGPLTLALAFGCFFYGNAFRRREEAPAWLFASAAFFWSWFCEALHFDDNYGGNLERYNTPFKIYYPLWPMLAGAMVVAVRELFARRQVVLEKPFRLLASGATAAAVLLIVIAVEMLKTTFPTLGWTPWLLFVPVGVVALLTLIPRTRRWGADLWSRAYSRAPALVVGTIIFMLGMLYPLQAIATRTHGLFSRTERSWTYNTQKVSKESAGISDSLKEDQVREMFSRDFGGRDAEFFRKRTLDGSFYLDQMQDFRGDRLIIEWLRENARSGDRILEAPSKSGSYSAHGRISAMTGLPTLVGWHHHEKQWRGWGTLLPRNLLSRFYDDLLRDAPMPQFLFSRILPHEGITDTDRQVLHRLAKTNDEMAEDQLRQLFPARDTAEIALLLVQLKGQVALMDTELRSLVHLAYDGMGALESALRTGFPQMDDEATQAWKSRSYGNAVAMMEFLQRHATHQMLMEYLVRRMEEVYSAPVLTDRVAKTLSEFDVRFVIVGSQEQTPEFVRGEGKFLDPRFRKVFEAEMPIIKRAEPRSGERTRKLAIYEWLGGDTAPVGGAGS